MLVAVCSELGGRPAEKGYVMAIWASGKVAFFNRGRLASSAVAGTVPDGGFPAEDDPSLAAGGLGGGAGATAAGSGRPAATLESRPNALLKKAPARSPPC
jgi:hypothetical protein